MEREVRRRRNEWRITKMVLIIFIAFLVTYLPITLVKSLDKKVEYPGERGANLSGGGGGDEEEVKP